MHKDMPTTTSEFQRIKSIFALDRAVTVIISMILRNRLLGSNGLKEKRQY
jgi:hypothetical protein